MTVEIRQALLNSNVSFNVEWIEESKQLHQFMSIYPLWMVYHASPIS